MRGYKEAVLESKVSEAVGTSYSQGNNHSDYEKYSVQMPLIQKSYSRPRYHKLSSHKSHFASCQRTPSNYSICPLITFPTPTKSRSTTTPRFHLSLVAHPTTKS